METILTFLETTSALRPLYLMSQMSQTELAIVFLLSKPVFVVTAACLVGGRSLRDRARRPGGQEQLASSRPNPSHLLEDP